MTDATDPNSTPTPAPGTGAEDAAYLAAVRAELADLEPDELEDVVDDLASHLHEVRSAGAGRPMTEILGPPQRYAAELRAAAGLGEPAAGAVGAAGADAAAVGAAAPDLLTDGPAGEARREQILVGAGAGVGTGAGAAAAASGAAPPLPPPPPPSATLPPPPAASTLPPQGPSTLPPPPAGAPYRPGDALGRAVTEAADRVTGHRWWQGVTEFLPELVPAWWVARAWLAVAVVGAITSGGDAFVGGGPVLLPRLFGSFVLGLIALVAAIVWSVRWGRARRGRLPQSAGMVAGAVILAGIVVVLLGLSFVVARSDSGPVYTEVSGTVLPPLSPVGAQGSAETALNVYAYRPDGTPVGPVLLYDESGRPLVVGSAQTDLSGRSAEAYSEALGQEAEVLVPTDANGVPVPNLYPRQLFEVERGPDGSVSRRPIPPPGVRVSPSVAPTVTTLPPTTLPPGTTASTVPAASTATTSPVTTPPASATTVVTGDPSTTATTNP